MAPTDSSKNSQKLKGLHGPGINKETGQVKPDRPGMPSPKLVSTVYSHPLLSRGKVSSVAGVPSSSRRVRNPDLYGKFPSAGNLIGQ